MTNSPMAELNKQALRGQSVGGSFYLVECCNCGEMYPSNLLDGGEAIADSGDYGDCYCHLCGADDTERADFGDVNSNEAKAWNFQQKRIEALLDELEAAEKRIAELESNEIREDGNQFLVVRHPGKTPVIKHCSGDLEEFLRNLIEQDPLVTIDIITHRYYGVSGQWVQDADEYLHMMAAAGIGVKGE